MDVNLIYHKTGYRFQISKYTPLSFIYEVAIKVFQLENIIHIFHKGKLVPYEPINSSNYFITFPVTLNVVEERKTLNQNLKFKTIEEKNNKEPNKQTEKKKKKNFIKCQICNRKNSIFFCRNCNRFVCFECNIRYPEHFNHQQLSLESGDAFLSLEEYRSIVLAQLNELKNAYTTSSRNIYSEKKRSNIFDSLLRTLNDLDRKTQSLSVMGSAYICNDEILKNYNKDIKDIPVPKMEEEIINAFGLVKEKELEISNCIAFVNLQIIKSKFNIKLEVFIKKIKKIFEELMIEINDKLNESVIVSQKNYNYIIAYNKENHKEKNSSSDLDSSSSSSFSSNKINKSSSSVSYSNNNRINIKKNLKKTSTVVDKKVDISKMLNNQKEHNIKKLLMENQDKKIDTNVNNKSRNLIKKSYKDNSLDVHHALTIKEDIDEYKGIYDDDYLTLPKLKKKLIDNKENKKILVSPNPKKSINIYDSKNLKTFEKSIKNVLSRNRKKTIDFLNKTDNYNKIDIIKEDKLSPKEKEGINIFQSNNDKNVNNIIDSYKNKNIQKNEKSKFNKIKTDDNIKSFDKDIKNKFGNILKRINPNKKIKFYDTYKFKEDDENSINNNNNEFPIPLKLKKNIKKISPISKNKKYDYD